MHVSVCVGALGLKNESQTVAHYAKPLLIRHAGHRCAPTVPF